MQSFITINGTKFPQPRRGLELLSATIVDSARNANGVVVGQKVGRDQQKLNNLFWGYLTAEQWSTMLQIFDKNFFVTVTYPDMVNNRWTTRKMYPGDRTATPYHLDLLWSSFFVTLVAKKIVLINLCCRPCFIWGSITIITVWTNMIIINVCKFFYLLIECFLCCKLIQICAFILQGIEITLHRCIVVRISCFAHALCHIYRFAEFGKCFGRIL